MGNYARLMSSPRQDRCDKPSWIFLGVDTPYGLDPSVDGQRCYMFGRRIAGAPAEVETHILPVSKFWGRGG